MTTEITNSEDIIDSRDIIARIDDLQDTFDTLLEAVTDADPEGEAEERAEALTALADWLEAEEEDILKSLYADSVLALGNSDEATELRVLKELAKEGEAYCSDWNYGEVIIRESHFEDYAKELAHDIGAVDRNAPWPLTHIDWKAAADALRKDYTEIDFDGVTYLTR